MTPKVPVPARLFVLLAREAPVGVILRRGPSDWVQMIHWDTKKDIFTPGQWFHGRIYGDLCDISPDGEHFVYAAHKARNYDRNPDYGNDWTAVSRPPYFTALTLWLHFTGNGGGGYFYTNDKMLLNHLGDNTTPHPNHPIQGFEIIHTDENTFMRDSVYHYVLIRNGWQLKSMTGRQTSLESGKTKAWGKWVNGVWIPQYKPLITLSRSSAGIMLDCATYTDYRNWWDAILYRRSRHVARLYRYEISIESTGKQLNWLDITWADFDQQSRLVLAKNGKIFSAALNQEDELSLTELADFNANKPDPAPSPDWAKKW